MRKLRPGTLPERSSVNRKMEECVNDGQAGTGLSGCPNLHHASNKQKCLVGPMATREGSFQVRFDRAILR